MVVAFAFVSWVTKWLECFALFFRTLFFRLAFLWFEMLLWIVAYIKVVLEGFLAIHDWCLDGFAGCLQKPFIPITLSKTFGKVISSKECICLFVPCVGNVNIPVVYISDYTERAYHIMCLLCTWMQFNLVSSYHHAPSLHICEDRILAGYGNVCKTSIAVLCFAVIHHSTYVQQTNACRTNRAHRPCTDITIPRTTIDKQIRTYVRLTELTDQRKRTFSVFISYTLKYAAHPS